MFDPHKSGAQNVVKSAVKIAPLRAGAAAIGIELQHTVYEGVGDFIQWSHVSMTQNISDATRMALGFERRDGLL